MARETLDYTLRDEWESFRRDDRAANRQVQEVYAVVSKVAAEGALMSGILANLSKSIDKLDDTLIAAVTGKKQVSLIAHLLTVSVMGIVTILVLVANTTKSIEFSLFPLRFKIENSANANHP